MTQSGLNGTPRSEESGSYGGRESESEKRAGDNRKNEEEER